MAPIGPEELVAAFDALFGLHDGQRAAHAKGLCCGATFTATPEAASLTRAPHMQGAATRTTVRFSNGSGDPTAHDRGAEPRGMAVKFHLEDGRATDVVSINHKLLIVRTPEEFAELVLLRVPDAHTGRIDLEALGAFVAARPESTRAAEILLTTPPLESFVRTEYFAVHAYRFVDVHGSVSVGRYRWQPALGVSALTKEEARARTPDYLLEDLRVRLVEGPVRFALHVQLAREGDDPSDPTQEWSDDHEQIHVGDLEITDLIQDQDRGCERLVFDPMRLCDGIEPSDDPILHARPGAYALSSRRRTKAARARDL